jgi:hypothetical protein
LLRTSFSLNRYLHTGTYIWARQVGFSEEDRGLTIKTACNGQLTTGFATLQYPYATLGLLHVPVLLLKLRLTLAGTQRKPASLSAHCRQEKLF